ncbi:MAG: thymidylate synthase [Candidatus Nomurabacteria bacterium]|jgi:thymidylate synthase|nr:thymidylate synthase [Candidatus Nomurabacteria bacterium]
MKQYLKLLDDVVNNGTVIGAERTGNGTIGVFSRQMRFNLDDGFPIVTTKLVHFRSVVHELIWFLKGSGNIEYLAQNNVHIWDEWPYKAYLEKQGVKADKEFFKTKECKGGMKEFSSRIATDHEFALEHGNLGPVYGVQWRHWPDGKGGDIDQILQAGEMLRLDPWSRRNIVSAWNVAEIPEIVRSGGLPPCHCMFQFKVWPDKDGNPSRLDLDLAQRSCDTFLGVPFNISSYSLLLSMFAHVYGLKPGEFIWSGKDVHVYLNDNIDQAKKQLKRKPHPLPKLWLNPKVKTIDGFTFEDIRLDGYVHDDALRGEIAV